MQKLQKLQQTVNLINGGGSIPTEYGAIVIHYGVVCGVVSAFSYVDKVVIDCHKLDGCKFRVDTSKENTISIGQPLSDNTILKALIKLYEAPISITNDRRLEAYPTFDSVFGEVPLMNDHKGLTIPLDISDMTDDNIDKLQILLDSKS